MASSTTQPDLAAVHEEVHAPSIVATDGDLNVHSSGTIDLTLGAERALTIDTDQSATNIDTVSKNLRVKSAALHMRSDELTVRAGESVHICVGECDEFGVDPSTFTAIARTEDDAAPASNVLDGDAATKWRSRTTNAVALPNWVGIDLGRSLAIRGVRLLGRQDYESADRWTGVPREIGVDTSPDGVTWTRAVDGTAYPAQAASDPATSPPAWRTFEFAQSIDTRYVRVVVISNVTGHASHASLASLAPIFANPDPSTFVASASSSKSAGDPARVLDGDASTSWHSNSSHPHWLAIDIQDRFVVSGLRMLPRQTYGTSNVDPREYRIEVSDDAVDWTEVAAGIAYPQNNNWQTSPANTWHTVAFSPVRTRHVRLHVDSSVASPHVANTALATLQIVFEGRHTDMDATALGMTVATRLGTSGGAALETTANTFAVRAGARAIAADATGKLAMRGPSHDMVLAGVSIMEVRNDVVHIRRDVEIQGVLNSITGASTTLQVADQEIRLATAASLESDVSGTPTGLLIDTVPGAAADANHVGGFKAEDGASLFVDTDSNEIDVPAARSAGIFAKRLAHRVGNGVRLAGARTREARSAAPRWEIEGGALRMRRDVASTEPGKATRFVMDMRVSDEGNFEIVRLKYPLTFNESTGKYAAGTPEVGIMQQSTRWPSSAAVIMWTQATDLRTLYSDRHALDVTLTGRGRHGDVVFAIASDPAPAGVAIEASGGGHSRLVALARAGVTSVDVSATTPRADGTATTETRTFVLRAPRYGNPAAAASAGLLDSAVFGENALDQADSTLVPVRISEPSADGSTVVFDRFHADLGSTLQGTVALEGNSLCGFLRYRVSAVPTSGQGGDLIWIDHMGQITIAPGEIQFRRGPNAVGTVPLNGYRPHTSAAGKAHWMHIALVVEQRTDDPSRYRWWLYANGRYVLATFEGAPPTGEQAMSILKHSASPQDGGSSQWLAGTTVDVSHVLITTGKSRGDIEAFSDSLIDHVTEIRATAAAAAADDVQSQLIGGSKPGDRIRSGGLELCILATGEVVFRDVGSTDAPIWSSGVPGANSSAPYTLDMQSDGNVVAHANGVSYWSSNTATDARPAEYTLAIDESEREWYIKRDDAVIFTRGASAS